MMKQYSGSNIYITIMESLVSFMIGWIVDVLKIHLNLAISYLVALRNDISKTTLESTDHNGRCFFMPIIAGR